MFQCNRFENESAVEYCFSIFYSGCNHYKSIHICGCKDTTNSANSKIKKNDAFFYFKKKKKKGSAAQYYAKSSKLPFVGYETGNVDLDEDINISDATEIQIYLAKLTDFSDLQLAAADTNSDGVVSIDDATRLQMYLAELGVDTLD